MTKIRIPADQISNFKAFAKAFSAIIQEKSSTRLRGRTLLNAFAQAAGHSDYNSLLYDAYAYGSGEFRWSTLPAKLSSGLSIHLGMDRFVVLTMLSEATLQVPDLASDIAAGAVGAYNPFAGVKPNLPGLPSPESKITGGTFNDAVRDQPDTGTFYVNGKSDAAPLEAVGQALIQAGALEFCRTDTSDLQSAGDDAAKAVYTNANHSVVIKLNQPDGSAGMPFPVYLSDTGMCQEDEQALTESFQKLGNMSVQVSELEAGRLVLDEIRDAVKERSGNDDAPYNPNMYLLDETPMPYPSDDFQRALNMAKMKRE